MKVTIEVRYVKYVEGHGGWRAVHPLGEAWGWTKDEALKTLVKMVIQPNND